MLHVLALTLLSSAASGAAASPAAPTNVRRWIEAFERPTLAGPGLDAAGRTLTFGHLELRLRSGRLYPVAAGGRILGLYFDGTGSLRYLSQDPLEDATYRLNVERATSLRVNAEGALQEELSSALVLLSSGADAFAGEGGFATGAPSAEGTHALAQHLERWSDDLTASPPMLQAQAALAPPGEALVTAQLHGSQHDLLYVRDTLLQGRETLDLVRKGRGNLVGSGRVADGLSQQAIGRDRLAPTAEAFSLADLDVTVQNRSGARADVQIQERLLVRAPLRTLAFGLENTFIGNTNATAGKALLKYELASVTDGEGHPLGYVHRDDRLIVDLGRQAAAGETLTLKLALSGDVLHRPEGDNYWLLWSNWYARPLSKLDNLSQTFTYHAVVKVPKPFAAFSVGKLVRRWDEGELACAEFRQERAVNDAFVLAGKYTTYTETRGALSVDVSTYGIPKERAAKQIAGLVHTFAAFYQPLLGEFPFSELHVLELNSYGLGIAPPGVVFMTKEAFGTNPVADYLGNVTVRGVNQRLAHEVAHAWWGNTVLPAHPEDQWISESVAEYYSALAMTLRDKDDFDDALASWRSESKAPGSVYLANFLEGDDAWLERRRLLYARGPLFLHAWRTQLGDQAFFTIFKSLVRSFPGKPAATRDVLAIGKLVTGQDQRPIFDRYLFGGEVPPKK